MDEKTLKNRLIKKKEMLSEREEKTLFEYLNSLHDETSIAIFISINEIYELITDNYKKELLWCLSQGILATHHYFYIPQVIGDLEFIEIYIQGLA